MSRVSVGVIAISVAVPATSLKKWTVCPSVYTSFLFPDATSFLAISSSSMGYEMESTS